MNLKLIADLAQFWENVIRKNVEVIIPDFFKVYIFTLTLSGRKIIPKGIKDKFVQGKSEQDLISFTYANLSSLQNHPSIADDFLQYLIRCFPNNASCLSLQAWFLISQGDFAKSEKNLSRALSIEHSEIDHVHLLNNLGYIYLIRDMPLVAEKNFVHIIEAEDTGREEGYPAILEIAFYKDGKIIPDYLSKLSRKICPRIAALTNLSTLALSRGDYDAAFKYAVQVLGAQPENSLGYELLGFISLARGDRQAAREAWSQAVDKTEEESHQALQVMLERLKRDSAENFPE